MEARGDYDYPKLRYVDVFPVQTQDGRMFALRDPGGIASETIVLSSDIFYLLQFFDGTYSQVDLREKYLHEFGTLLYEEQLDEILKSLDAHLFLENQNFFQQQEQIVQQFLDLPIRPAVHAGQSYPSDPEQLRQRIDGFFEHRHGPGALNGKVNQRQVKGLIAPHIDLRVGGACYAHAYKALAESPPADCYVILGTGHSGLLKLYSVLEKDFDTPLGPVKHDADFVGLLQSKYDEFEFSDLLSHKTEHTIEFQTLFLQYLFGGQRDFTVVPILCSFAYQMLDDKLFPDKRKCVDRFCDALKQTIAEVGKNVCVIASVDLSHVGKQYGDESAPDDSLLQQIQTSDHAALKSAGELDSASFHRTLSRSGDVYRMCGFSPIYTLLRSLEAEEGELLNYSQAAIDSENSIVTFASMVFY